MLATLEVMSRPKKPPTESVRIDRDIIKTVRVIAAATDETVPAVITRLLNEVIGPHFDEAMKRLDRDRSRSSK